MNECTVLMSTYNGQAYLRDQIDSILNQEGVKLKLVIRDDGSKDGTCDILNEYINNHGEQITVYFGDNVGIHKSFATLMCVPQLTGYIAFADQDDVWDKDKLSIAINQLISHNVDFYSSASRLVDSNLNDLGLTTCNVAQYNHYSKGFNRILTPGVQGCTMVLKNSLFKKIVKKGIPDYYGHDTWIAVVAFYMTTHFYDCNPHMSYRQHNKSWTGNRGDTISQLKREYHFFKNGMCRYALLAKDVIEKFSDDLSDVDLLFLRRLSNNNKTITDRLALAFNKDFRKYGWLRNIFFKIEVLKGNV